MKSLLRQIVAGPRIRHDDAGLDLCYVTDFIVATSGPSQTYPQRAYRNPLDQLVAFLDAQHGEDWAIWEFRAEGTGYPDDQVYNRIRHYPWPDHHPPPFKLVPLIMASMRSWLHGGDLQGPAAAAPTTGGSSSSSGTRDGKRVAVVHCKAGKGRSGTVTCSYLVAEEGWRAEDALARFTQRRMRPMFGAGVSIPSQLRWVSYVQRWTDGGKKYRDAPIEVVELHVWGLRDGVKVDVEGFADDGKRIEVLHTFKKNERFIVEGGAPDGGGIKDMMWEIAGYPTGEKAPEEAPFSKGANDELREDDKASSSGQSARDTPKLINRDTMASQTAPSRTSTTSSSSSKKNKQDGAEPGGQAVIFRPTEPIRVPNSDVNISVERRNKTHKSIGLTMVSAVAHVWINTFFEGNGPEQGGRPDDSGIFTIDWDAMDGIKGSSRKGARALDRLSVVWRYADNHEATAETDTTASATEPKEGEPVPQFTAANWQGPLGVETEQLQDRDLGLRVQSPASADVSKASSIMSETGLVGKAAGAAGDRKEKDNGDGEALEGVKTCGPTGEELHAEKLQDTAHKS
ncbi:Telomerase protein component 1 [Lecanicillium sp. MT-2017a]|nr:Telomerase protein component 1 [Lecanicillium sp. MT-2017a]